MLIRSWKDQEWLLLCRNLDIIRIRSLKVINFRLPKNKCLSLDCPLLECDPSSHILDMLNNEINRHSIVSKARNNDVCVHYRWKNEISKCIFDEFVVLLQYADHWSTSLSCISLQPPAKSYVVFDKCKNTIAVYEYFVGEKIPNSFIIESHQSLEKDDVSWTNHSGLLHSSMLNERILRYRNGLIGLYQIN